MANKVEVVFHTCGWIEHGSDLSELYDEIKKKRKLIKELELEVEFMVDIHEQRSIKAYYEEKN